MSINDDVRHLIIQYARCYRTVHEWLLYREYTTKKSIKLSRHLGCGQNRTIIVIVIIIIIIYHKKQIIETKEAKKECQNLAKRKHYSISPTLAIKDE